MKEYKLLEASGKIDGVKMKLNAKGNKMYSVTIDKLIYKVFDYFPSFKQLQTNEIEIGDTVEVFYAESEYEYQGKPTMSRHLKRFVKSDPEPKPKKVEVNKKVEEKAPVIERIDVVEFVKEIVKPVNAEPVKREFGGATSLQQLSIIRQSSLKSAVEFVKGREVNANYVLEIAEHMEKWVLR